MVPNYYFVFGRVPALSAGELYRLVKGGEWLITNHAALIKSGGPIDVRILNEKLAGTVKAGKIITIAQRRDVEQWFESFSWIKLVRGVSRFEFGLSDYTDEAIGDLKKYGLKVKKKLKASGIQSRLVTGREKILSSVIVTKNKLIENGIELCFFRDGEIVYIGRTMSVQDFEQFGKRDYGRPQTQVREGMLPPKLARMMIHLADTKIYHSLLDPFCGAGTVLQEAAGEGMTEIVGSDIEEEAVDKAKKNLDWYIREYKPEVSKIDVIQSDIITLNRRLLGRAFDRIVSEGYLGPPLKSKTPSAKKSQILNELHGFYERVLPALENLLAPRGVAVLALPAIKINGVWKRLDLKRVFISSGFAPEPIVPEGWNKILRVDDDSIIYSRPQQQVGREIFILRKK